MLDHQNAGMMTMMTKNKFMQKMMLRLFGHKPPTKEQLPPIRFNTTVPNNKPSQEQWMREFNVGMMWDRKIVHINHK
mgnify:FL=1